MIIRQVQRSSMPAGSVLLMSDNKIKDTDYTFDKVPLTARKGFLAMFFLLLGFTFYSGSMSVGAKLGNGFDLKSFCLAVLIGGLILSVYTGILAYIGAQTGLSFDLLAQRTFGSAGSILPSSLIAVTQAGWFGVGVAMLACAAADVIGCSPWPIVLVSGLCMTATAYFGIKGMEIVSYISVPLILILGSYSIYVSLNAGDGISGVFEGHVNSLTIAQGIGLVVGSFISGGTTTPNFTRFCKDRKSAVISAVIAFFAGNTLMFVFGAVGGAFTGRDDIFYVMIAQGLTVPAMIVLGANIWTTNNNGLYSSALGLSNLTKAPKRPMVIVAGVVGTLASLWLYDNFISWLSILNVALPPIGTVIIADYILNRAHYNDDYDMKNNPKINVGSVAGIVAGVLAGILLDSVGIPTLNSVLAACLCYVVFNCRKIFGNMLAK